MRDFKKIWLILSKQDKLQIIKITAILTISALFQVFAIAAVMPFFAIIAEPNPLEKYHALAQVSTTLNISTKEDFLLAAGLFVLATTILSNTMLAWSTWVINKFGLKYAQKTSMRLLHKYIQKEYSYFLKINSSELISNVNQEVWRTVTGALIPAMNAVSAIIKATVILSLLVYANALATAIIASIVITFYCANSFYFRKKLTRYGEQISINTAKSGKAIKELFEGIKEIKLLNLEEFFSQRYKDSSEIVIRNEMHGRMVGQLPRYMLDIILFGTLLSAIIILIKNGIDFNAALPYIILFIYSGYRLMPIMQEIYVNISYIKYAIPAVDNISKDLLAPAIAPLEPTRTQINFDKKIELKNITYSYPGAESPSLKDLNLNISAHTTVGLIGSSGAGKSTLVDVLLGLLFPTEGTILADNRELNKTDIRNWQKKIGYVPQQIYLTDDTILRNIALGIPDNLIDLSAAVKAAKAANLHDFISTELESGYNTLIGERGTRLSGGQRQRIGIARALYSNPSILILDEATSALDSITEDAIMKSISELSNSKTIIMIAHRLTTLKDCDIIHRMEHGAIVESGKYNALLQESSVFRSLARLASQEDTSIK